MPQQCCLYVVFSSTASKMGKFIRVMTRNRFNHVSVATDNTPELLYSFARLYCNVPLYGGFVRESCLRYRSPHGRYANIRVCAVPVSQEQAADIRSYIDQMNADSEKYIYNTASAILSPIHRRIVSRCAFTCVEFVSGLMVRFGVLPPDDAVKFYSVDELADLLKKYCIYEGDISGYMSRSCGWNGDTFQFRKKLSDKIRLTALAGARMFSVLFKKSHV